MSGGALAGSSGVAVGPVRHDRRRAVSQLPPYWGAIHAPLTRCPRNWVKSTCKSCAVRWGARGHAPDDPLCGPQLMTSRYASPVTTEVQKRDVVDSGV
jgi:hypothetical protein